MRTMFRVIVLIVVALKFWGSLVEGQTFSEQPVARLGKGRISQVAYSPDGTLLVVASSVGIWLYDANTLVEVGLVGEDWVTSVAFSSDSRLLASGNQDGTVRLWDIGKRQEVASLPGYTWVSSVTFSSDGRLLASAGWDNTVVLWDVVSHKEVEVFEGSNGGDNSTRNSVAFSSDGRLLAWGRGRTVQVWNVVKRQYEARLDVPELVKSVAFSSDGQLFAFAREDNTVQVLDLAGYRQVVNFENIGNSVVFSRDGLLLASIMGNTVRLGDVKQSQRVAVLEGHTDDVVSVTFSPDGQLLASGSGDNTVRMWDMGRRQEIVILGGHIGEVRSVTFSPNGKVLAAGNQDGTVSLWGELSPIEPIIEPASVTFTEVGAMAGVNDSVRAEGVAWGDYDNDGDLDLYAASRDGVRLYRNNGGGIFTDVSAGAGMNNIGDSQAVVWGDYDNDDDLDLYVTYYGSASRLYRNTGDGTFMEVAASAGVDNSGRGRGAAWGDYDNDGDIDLFVTNEGGVNRLYRNDGDGRFTEVGASVGMNENTNGINGIGVAWGDYDDDGDLDLFVARQGEPNQLYQNKGNGTFAEVGVTVGMGNSGGGVGVAWGDYDNDGDLDLDVSRESGGNRLYRNNGDGTFTNVSVDAGVNDTGSGMGVAWGDYDNDGNLDLYLANDYGENRLYRNNGDGTFTDVGVETGVRDGGRSFAPAWGDYDNDGDLDLYVSKGDSPNRLYRNNGTINRWLVMRLVGTGSNRSGIGARVMAVTGTKRQRRDVDGGSGYQSQPSLPVEFGFGSTTIVDSLLIRWPSGTVQTLTNVATNQILTVTEPTPTLTPALMIVSPTSGQILPAGTTSTTLTVTISNHTGHWHWQLNTPFPTNGAAGGNVVTSGNTTTITGLQEGQTYTVYVTLVDANHTVLSPPVTASVTFSVAAPAPQPVPPTVSNVQAAQRRDGSRLVDITYNLSDPDSDSLLVTVELSPDDGKTWTPLRTVSGAVGRGVTPGVRKQVVWNVGVDYPGQVGRNSRVRVTADDANLSPGGGSNKTITMTLPGGATIEMVWIPPGTFLMGTTEEQEQLLRNKGLWYDWFENEHPAHEVTITTGFYLGMYEVTQGQWTSVMGTKPWAGQSYVMENPEHPAVYVSWEDAQEFLRRVNAAEGAGVYRLPTEAEWEYACRAGTTTLWSFGEDEGRLKDHAWYRVNAWNVGEQYAHKVGTKLPNPWGLYDMHGNVWEWCQDWWYRIYTADAQVDPVGPGSGSDRVVRGGGFDFIAQHVRSAIRINYWPARYDDVGFRLLRQGQ